MNGTSAYELGPDRWLSYAHIRRTIRLGVKSIWMHGLRSLLTVLGIVFGVCSVIAMLAVGEGASADVQAQIKKLGSDNIIIESVKPADTQQSSQSRGPSSLEYGLTYRDIATIKNVLPNVKIIVPARLIPQTVWRGTRNLECKIMGTVPWYPEMRNHKVARGRFITQAEMDEKLNVCVLGDKMVRQLFPIDNPIGKNVKVEGSYYRVVGVMEPATRIGKVSATGGEAGDLSGSSASYRMFIPLTAAKYRFGETILKRSSGSFEAEKVELHEVTVQVANQEDIIEISLIIDEILDRNHKKQDYAITVPLELMRSAEETKRIFNIVLGAIAGISLVVGGIGIMNIMLASVTERTREIGIRRALGAKKRDIVLQFLVETVILSGAGGLIGVLLGVTIPFFITYFSDMPTIVTLWSAVLAFSISAMVGIVFGIYPAFRAAEMDPVEALRHE